MLSVRPLVLRQAQRVNFTYLLSLLLFGLPVAAQTGSVTITSPANNSTSPSAVLITAYASNEPSSFDHYEIWDTNSGESAYKLGTVPKTSNPNAVFVLPNGAHSLTVEAVTAAGGSGGILNSATVTFNVAESCSDSSTVQCDMDQLGIQNPESNCNPSDTLDEWVGNPCGAGGNTGIGVSITHPSVSTPIPDAGNLTLNGHSPLQLSITPDQSYSNVIFGAYSPTTTGSTTDSHWTLDEYVYLPNPSYNQALELDIYYVSPDGVWTTFTTECAFIYNNGPGYWAVYDGGSNWAFLDGSPGVPKVPCLTSQFATPWANSGDPSFTGWHHVVWKFVRNTNGSVTYTSLQFDGTLYNLNYTPTQETAGNGGNLGYFASMVQLDSTANMSEDPQVYVSELNITHTP
ncbi:MAG TPA: hypothetical protein VGM18_03750 [Candidatus Sulfotelmatobacter sp.]|jgi:hypothetical protein